MEEQELEERSISFLYDCFSCPKMHTFIYQTDGWTVETLADDSDLTNNSHSPTTLEKELQGCCFIKEARNNRQYTCEIRYEEQKHNKLILVEAIVFEDHDKEEYTEEDIRYARRSKFEGDDCKRNAAKYARHHKEVINKMYFS